MREDRQRKDHPVNNMMKCLASGCEFNTDADMQFQFLSFHLQLVQTPVPVQTTLSPSVQTTTQRRKPEKFPRPNMGVDKTREGWDNFELNWVQYKEDSELKGED